MSDSPLNKLTRRDVLGAALAAPLARAWFGSPSSAVAGQAHPPQAPVTFYVDTVRGKPGFVVGTDGHVLPGLDLQREWSGATCRSRLTNRGATPVRIKEIVLFDGLYDIGGVNASLYAESFQMLSQTWGVAGTVSDVGSYSDAAHYRIPTPQGTRAFFGAMTIEPHLLYSGPREVVGLGFASTRKFAGLFRLGWVSLQAVIDAEGLTLGPGETWQLEDFVVAPVHSREDAMSAIGAELAKNHPRLPWPKPPAGWCSWYCFGARVTAQNILDNLEAIAAHVPELTYVQIDDGYQPAMGDWLETGSAFGGDVRHVIDEIRKRGFQPAIWVAPFIAERDSHVFQQHPGWFVQDPEGGGPLRSDKVTFGGWRRGPWYALDGTHPEVQAHFEHVFRTMHREWGVTYFKLDANFWGAIHGGRFHDPNATRIEAYRRGMQAILRGAGDSFILGCNHPIWPSAGLVHGSRTSNDIKRSWDRITSTARENLLRGWQNGVLWWNDPDAACLTGDLPENEFVFHATVIYAIGGMVLSGDDVSKMPADRLAMLKKLLPPTGVRAVFDDDFHGVGRVNLGNRQMVCLFNWYDKDWTYDVTLVDRSRVRDVWTGASLGRHRSMKVGVPRHSARLLECTRE